MKLPGIQASGFTEVIQDEVLMQEKSLLEIILYWKYCINSGNNIVSSVIPPTRELIEDKKEKLDKIL